MDRGPYDSPHYSVTFYPEDVSFNALVQTIRKTCRTIELFEIARTVVAKTERFVVVLMHKAAPVPEDLSPRPALAAPESLPEPSVRQQKPVFHVAVPDGMPFETDDAAVSYVLSKHLDKFFETSEVEIEPPKGSFQVINKCGVTGELLGPPNYHRYNQIVQQHYAARLSGKMPVEVFRARIETVRDPEVVNQWLNKMRKTTRYVWRAGGKGGHAPAPQPAQAESGESQAETPVPPPPATPTFDTLEDARLYLLTHGRDKVVRTAETARFHGKLLENLAPGEIRRAVEGALERQRRFPLDTANALRGRLRREHFTIFKKGSKGVSYVCAVKRKFRVPGQTFSDSIGALIGFIEANPMIRASELPAKFLGVALPDPARSQEPATGSGTSESGPRPDAAGPAVEPTLTIEDRARISRMQGDLMWLVREGYVTEFIDGRLFAPPPMVEARKREVETSEHDPENFPEAPPLTDAQSPESVPTEAPASPEAPRPESGAPEEAALTDAQSPESVPTEAPMAPEAPQPESEAPETPAPEDAEPSATGSTTAPPENSEASKPPITEPAPQVPGAPEVAGNAPAAGAGNL